MIMRSKDTGMKYLISVALPYKYYEETGKKWLNGWSKNDLWCGR